MQLDLEVNFNGGLKVSTDISGQHIPTDQPVAEGGEGTAPAPFDLFLASMATCSGIYVQRFLEVRHIPLDGLRVIMHVLPGEDKKQLLGKIKFEVILPPGFPEKYHKAVCKAVDSCAVKKAIVNPPEFEVVAIPS